jgi:hypothetical protein
MNVIKWSQKIVVIKTRRTFDGLALDVGSLFDYTESPRLGVV